MKTSFNFHRMFFLFDPGLKFQILIQGEVVLREELQRLEGTGEKEVAEEHIPKEQEVTEEHIPKEQEVTEEHFPKEQEVTEEHIPKEQEVTEGHIEGVGEEHLGQEHMEKVVKTIRFRQILYHLQSIIIVICRIMQVMTVTTVRSTTSKCHQVSREYLWYYFTISEHRIIANVPNVSL